MKLLQIINGMYVVPLKRQEKEYICKMCNAHLYHTENDSFRIIDGQYKEVEGYTLRITEAQMSTILKCIPNTLIYLNWSKTMKKIFNENGISHPCVIKLYTDHQHVYVEYYDGIPVICRGSRKYAIRVRYKVL